MGGMGRATAWVITGVVVAALTVGLLVVAGHRFPVPPVSPPWPVPDYAIQASVSWIAIGAVVIGGVVVGVIAGRRSSGRTVVVGWGSAALVAVATVGAIAAFALSAR